MSFVMSPLKDLLLNVDKWNPAKEAGDTLIKYIDLSSVDKDSKRIIDDEVQELFGSKAPSRARQLVSEKDILVATVRPNLNGVASVPGEFEGATASTGYCVLRVNEELLDSKYLFYWVQTELFVNNMISKASGANYPAVSDKIIKDSKIPLPPLEEQKRIAAILDKADAIRQKRKQAIDLADEFLRSVFLDMFGDPVMNPKGWEVEKFANVGSLDRGKSKHRPRNDPKLLGGLHPLVQTGDVANSKGYLRSYTSTYSDFGLAQSKKWPAGTLCITIAANIAKTGILTFDACFPDSVVGFTPNSKTTTEYVQAWISFLQKILEANAPESAQKNINLAILRDLDMPVPPISEQKKFTMIVEKVNSILNRTRVSEESKEQLFNSLSQKVFSGQL
ncbi:restriction endonuclease subunit S [Photobacterium andalusiense]|uniref:EcoKI restriction-modification system protein HsdS n=1 Tax=Photobacterium andalusiense TaxID=2204296 RepID=A0A1Y6MEF3_9GAMM|nr:restriction endonuclease subunit S [Photobacterium andalusiense]SMY34953.1 EcoKI restriction-modification system protein HsdS [Photobacterium andalusiense]